jgi:hypothetical protein
MTRDITICGRGGTYDTGTGLASAYRVTKCLALATQSVGDGVEPSKYIAPCN